MHCHTLKITHADNGTYLYYCFIQVELRPDRYYELTDGCELTFADVQCQYIFGPPPEKAGEEEEEDMSGEQTQAYNLPGEEEEEEEREEGERDGECEY